MQPDRPHAGIFLLVKMASILDGELAQTLVDALTDARIPQSLAIVSIEVDPNSPPWNPSTIELNHACRGWVDSYAATEIGAGAVLASDRKVFVICASLVIVPNTSDHITIDGLSYAIVSVGRDPAGAAWILQVRR